MIAFTSVASFVKLPLTHVLPQTEATLLRQFIQKKQIGETYSSCSIFYCCNICWTRRRSWPEL